MATAEIRVFNPFTRVAVDFPSLASVYPEAIKYRCSEDCCPHRLPPRRPVWATRAAPSTSTSRPLVRSAALAVAGGCRQAKPVWLTAAAGIRFFLPQAATWGQAAEIVSAVRCRASISVATSLGGATWNWAGSEPHRGGATISAVTSLRNWRQECNHDARRPRRSGLGVYLHRSSNGTSPVGSVERSLVELYQRELH
jgi:hypothetical protein